MFFGAIDIIREHRNQSGHTNDLKNISKEKEEAIKKFQKITKKCDFKNDVRGLYGNDNINDHRKWISRLTTIAVLWLRKLQQNEQ